MENLISIKIGVDPFLLIGFSDEIFNFTRPIFILQK